jgi:broad specificity phosphatase PhoE
MNEKVKVLQDVPWGKPALALLSHAKNLKPDTPAVIVVRHSERNDISSVDDYGNLGLNPTGLKAAHEFGSLLPADRNYHFYHSPVSRCRQTAENIREGLQDRGVTVNSLIEMRSLARIYITRESYLALMGRDGRNFVYNWLAGHYPPWDINLSLNVAQKAALEIRKIVKKASSSDTYVFASHDLQVTAFLFHWAGILLSDSYIQFLDGFIFQKYDNKLVFYYKNGKKEFQIPYWWDSEGTIY